MATGPGGAIGTGAPCTVQMMDFGFDPQRALGQLRRLAADAPAQLADGFGRLVRDATPDRLEQIMRSPARRALLDGIFWQMPRQLDASRATAVSTAIQWNITGRADDGLDIYLLIIDTGQARTTRGTDGPAPKLTITMDGVEFLRLVSGNSDPMSAYFKGRIQLAGDIMVAAQMAQMFRMPGARADGPSGSSGNGGNGGNGGGSPDEPHDLPD
ncbi:MAG: SCP2 sterol-binding domain-containing protein [Solirubrobacteraceae bacterium]